MSTGRGAAHPEDIARATLMLELGQAMAATATAMGRCQYNIMKITITTAIMATATTCLLCPQIEVDLLPPIINHCIRPIAINHITPKANMPSVVALLRIKHIWDSSSQVTQGMASFHA